MSLSTSALHLSDSFTNEHFSQTKYMKSWSNLMFCSKLNEPTVYTSTAETMSRLTENQLVTVLNCLSFFMQKHFMVPASQMWRFAAFLFNDLNVFLIMLKFGLLVWRNIVKASLWAQTKGPHKFIFYHELKGKLDEVYTQNIESFPFDDAVIWNKSVEVFSLLSAWHYCNKL